MHYVNDSANAAYLRECREMEADCDGEWLQLTNEYVPDNDAEDEALSPWVRWRVG